MKIRRLVIFFFMVGATVAIALEDRNEKDPQADQCLALLTAQRSSNLIPDVERRLKTIVEALRSRGEHSFESEIRKWMSEIINLGEIDSRSTLSRLGAVWEADSETTLKIATALLYDSTEKKTYPTLFITALFTLPGLDREQFAKRIPYTFYRVKARRTLRRVNDFAAWLLLLPVSMHTKGHLLAQLVQGVGQRTVPGTDGFINFSNRWFGDSEKAAAWTAELVSGSPLTQDVVKAIMVTLLSTPETKLQFQQGWLDCWLQHSPMLITGTEAWKKMLSLESFQISPETLITKLSQAESITPGWVRMAEVAQQLNWIAEFNLTSLVKGSETQDETKKFRMESLIKIISGELYTLGNHNTRLRWMEELAKSKSEVATSLFLMEPIRIDVGFGPDSATRGEILSFSATETQTIISMQEQ